MNSNPVIVTGAAGFIGSALACALVDRGHHVLGIDNFDPLYDPEIKHRNVNRILEQPGDGRFELAPIDILDSDALTRSFAAHRPLVVFHLAAMAGVRPSIEQPRRYADVNITGLVNVLEACRKVNCPQLVFASSSSVYGNNPKTPFAEDDLVEDPISPYAATKRTGEIICQTWARLYGMRIAALRLFTVFGPSQRPDLAIAKFMRMIARGEQVPMFGDGSASRDYTFIDDAVAGIIAAEDSMNRQFPLAPGSAEGTMRTHPGELPGGGFFRIYNIGSDHPIALREMIDAIAKVVGKPACFSRLPMQPGDVQRTWADLARSRAELGYRPVTKFEQGLRRQWSQCLDSRQKSPSIAVSVSLNAVARRAPTAPAKSSTS